MVQPPKVLETQIKVADEVLAAPLLPRKLNIFASQLKTFMTGTNQEKRLVSVFLVIFPGWTDLIRGRAG